jgi:hypothetical protein
MRKCIVAVCIAGLLGCVGSVVAADEGPFYRVIGNGLTTGTECTVRLSTGEAVDSWECGRVFAPFNVFKDTIQVPVKGRMGLIPRTAAVQLTPAETVQYKQQRAQEVAQRIMRVRAASMTPRETPTEPKAQLKHAIARP